MSGTDKQLAALLTWCQVERGKLGAVDGYNYKSGEEYGIRRVELQIERVIASENCQPLLPLPDGEAVAWRWRYRNFPGEMGWIVVASKPKDHDDVEIQPLYTSLPASKIKIIPGGPPCPTCGFRLVQREQSPFVADDE